MIPWFRVERVKEIQNIGPTDNVPENSESPAVIRVIELSLALLAMLKNMNWDVAELGSLSFGHCNCAVRIAIEWARPLNSLVIVPKSSLPPPRFP